MRSGAGVFAQVGYHRGDPHTPVWSAVTVTPARHLWLNPGVVILALAAAVVLAAGSLQLGREWLHPKLFGAPTTAEATPPPEPSRSPEPSYTLSGRVRLHAGEFTAEGQRCAGEGEAEEVDEGSLVGISDATGFGIGYTRLGAGELVNERCEFPFTVTAPIGKGTYGVTVPHWGQFRYSEAELPNLLELTIG